MSTLNWNATAAELTLITAIAQRARRDLRHFNLDQRTVMMDVEACHSNGCPLDLAGLLAATPFDFAHDLGGIAAHLDRATGKLGDCFSPRYRR